MSTTMVLTLYLLVLLVDIVNVLLIWKTIARYESQFKTLIRKEMFKIFQNSTSRKLFITSFSTFIIILSFGITNHTLVALQLSKITFIEAIWKLTLALLSSLVVLLTHIEFVFRINTNNTLKGNNFNDN